MKSLSSLSKAFVCACTAALAALAGALASLIAMPAVETIALSVAVVAGCLAVVFLMALRRFLAEVGDVAHRVALGDFEARILDVSEHGDMGRMRDLVNDMIDRCDAFIREASAKGLDGKCLERIPRPLYVLPLGGAS